MPKHLADYFYTASTSVSTSFFLRRHSGEDESEIDGLDGKPELAQCIMLTNLLRLRGCVKQKKASRNFVTRPTEVVLPLSPNHGLFGNDGPYPEDCSRDSLH